MSCPLISNFRFLKNSHFTAPFGNADLSEAPGSTTLCSINRCTTNSYNSIIDHEILTHHLVESQSRIGSHSNELRKHSPILLSLFLAISRILGFNKSSYRSHHSRRMKGCLGLIVTYFLLFSIHANATSEHVQMLSAMSFLDEHEFQTQCRNQKIDLNLFHFSASSIANSQEFWKSSHEIDDGSFLGNELSFPAALTDLPISFHVASMGHPTSNYNGIIFTHVPDQAGGKHSALQINSKPGNDDLRISFSNKIYHKSAPYQHLYAVGINLHGNVHNSEESFKAFSLQGELLIQFQLPPPSQTHGTSFYGCIAKTFVGVISAQPIHSIALDENGNDKDVVAIKELYLGTANAHLLEDMSPSQQRLFWTGFNIFIILTLAIDLFWGGSRSVVLWDALFWSAIWIIFALLFATCLFAVRGRGPALIWLTSYLLEKFLSVDNLFVFLTIFASFRTPSTHQHKVLAWGIAGAIILRAVFIFTGVLLVETFSWLLAFFGLFLLYTGFRALMEIFQEDDEDSIFKFSNNDDLEKSQIPVSALKNNLALSIVGSIIPMSRYYDSRGRFFISNDESDKGEDGEEAVLPLTTAPASSFRQYFIHFKRAISAPVRGCLHLCGLQHIRATPLLAVLVIVETTDMVFAADSIPAVLSITQDPFVAYTSNIFAVLGLRALYFALAAAMTKFKYLGPGLGVILLFIGIKLLLVMVGVHISVEITLLLVLSTLAGSILLSMLHGIPTSKTLNHVNCKNTNILRQESNDGTACVSVYPAFSPNVTEYSDRFPAIVNSTGSPIPSWTPMSSALN
eukprot:gene9538-1768_t